MLRLYRKQLYWPEGLDCLFLSIFIKSIKEATNGRELASKKIQRNSTTYVSEKTSRSNTKWRKFTIPSIYVYAIANYIYLEHTFTYSNQARSV